MSRRPTSDEAWASVPEAQKESVRAMVYRTLARAEMTHEGLAAALAGRASIESIRTRCGELVQAGCVVDSGRRVATRSGRQAIVWAVAGPWRDYEGPSTPDPARTLEDAVGRAVAFLGGGPDVDEATVRLLLGQAYARDPSLRWRAGGEAPPAEGGQTRFW